MRHLLTPHAVLRLLVVVAGLIGLVFSGSGCASIVRGSSEKLTIQSMPSGAQVRLSTGQAGVTPWEVEVKRKDTIFVTVTKDGYKEMSTAVISSIDGASLGIGTVANFVTLPILNDVIDYKTGAKESANHRHSVSLSNAPRTSGVHIAVDDRLLRRHHARTS